MQHVRSWTASQRWETDCWRWSDKTEISTGERKVDKASVISAFRCLVNSLWICSYTFLHTSWIYSHMQEWTATLRCFYSLKIWIASFLLELIMNPCLIGLQPYRDRVAVDHFDSDFSRSPFGTERHGTARQGSVCANKHDGLSWGLWTTWCASKSCGLSQLLSACAVIRRHTQRQNLTSEYILLNIFI